VKELQKYVPGLGVTEWWKPLGDGKGVKIATEEDIRAYEEAMREMDKQLLKQEILDELGIAKVGTYEVSKKDKKTMTNGNGHCESKIVLEKELTNYLMKDGNS